MTDKPTDEEIIMLAVELGVSVRTGKGAVKLTRAVLAKWGQPAQAAGPVAWRVHPFDYGIGYEGVYAMTMREDQRETWRRKGWNTEPLFTAPQPVALEPLTDWDMRGQLAASLHCWHRLTANEAEELVAFVQRIAAHGIKGGQHGTE